MIRMDQEAIRLPQAIVVLCIACGRAVEVPILIVDLHGPSVYVERPHCAKPARERSDS
jgi:hypothetical protein